MNDDGCGEGWVAAGAAVVGLAAVGLVLGIIFRCWRLS